MVGENQTLPNAVVGALVSAGLFFVPFSPIFGGTVAGYLQKQGAEGGVKAGATKGVVATVPFALLAVVAGGFVSQVPIIGGLLTGGLGLVVVVLLIYAVGFGVAGGLIGGAIAGSSASSASSTQAGSSGGGGNIR